MEATQQAAWPALGVAAKAIIRRGDGRILIIKRASESGTDADCWDLPGGKMGYGETIREVLVREVREETGLEVSVGPVVHVSHFIKEPFWVTCITFACDYEDGEIRLSEEHSDFAWIEASEIPERTYGIGIRQQLDAYVGLARDG
jgi:8-oxo-dGTP diphosphatase